MALKALLGRPVRSVVQRFGYELHRMGEDPGLPLDYDDEAIDLFKEVQPYTLTGHERVVALRDAVRYVIAADVPGAIVECGVWKGGSMLAVIKSLLALGVRDRDLYLYDTFTHMPPPGPEDTYVRGGWSGDDYERFLGNPFYANDPVERVRALMESSGYPPERLHFVAGMVEDTIPETAPDAVALCRLDTDLYVSTAHEMLHLFPRIVENGVLLVDDYGHFMGSRKAVDEYLAERGIVLLLHRIDYTGRMAIVTRPARERAVAASALDTRPSR